MKKFFYRVREDDSVLIVANKFSLPPISIIKLNNLKSEISEGDLLYIENVENTYFVKPYDTIKSIAEKFHVEESEIKEKNNIDYVFYGLTIYI